MNNEALKKDYRQFVEAFCLFKVMLNDKGLTSSYESATKLGPAEVVSLFDMWFQKRGAAIWMEDKEVRVPILRHPGM